MAIDLDEQTGALLKVLAEPNRWRIVELLAGEELCVCHLVDELAIDQPLVSHHLRMLRNAGVVESERFRYWTYYRLRAGAIDQLGARLRDLAASAPTEGEHRRPCC